MNWIEKTVECPACGQSSFDELGSVDFEWDHDGISDYVGFSWICRVCELELSNYELELVSNGVGT